MCPLNFPPQGGGGKNPKKGGSRERKEAGVGYGNTSGNKLKKENFHLSAQESTCCRHFKIPFAVYYVMMDQQKVIRKNFLPLKCYT